MLGPSWLDCGWTNWTHRLWMSNYRCVFSRRCRGFSIKIETCSRRSCFQVESNWSGIIFNIFRFVSIRISDGCSVMFVVTCVDGINRLVSSFGIHISWCCISLLKISTILTKPHEFIEENATNDQTFSSTICCITLDILSARQAASDNHRTYQCIFDIIIT